MGMSNFHRGLAILAFSSLAAFAASPAAAADPDEAELLTHFDKVDVWHFPVDTTVRYNDQDAIVSRELVFKPEAPKGELCYVRFDLLRGDGDYGYGFKPATAPGERKNTIWGTNVLKRGTVLDQYYSTLKLNVVYFFVEGPKSATAKEICATKQAAPTAQAGNAYKGPWADLVTRVRAVHGWPAQK
ncbi:hypothetical protein LMG27198_12460 [Methylocystis echinoides]|uniref:Uncharacterized protein n=2 Tax=Methylocystis echinoides TaxID=29468 RepID=A0A9W6GSS0_9HYPH|nr:hypothetical protein LMG27198_12460 [Methylocystis echinoides]